MRILIGPFKAYSGLLYELYLGPMMVNIRTFGTCKLNIHELAQKYQIKSNSEKIYHTELTKLKMVSLENIFGRPGTLTGRIVELPLEGKVQCNWSDD